MKTLLVIAQQPLLAEAIRGALNPEHYRLSHRLDVEEAEPLLSAGVVDVCVFDAEIADTKAVWSLEKLRTLAPGCPVLVYTGVKPWEWEEEAYLQGVAHVLGKPVRPRLLNDLLERLLATPRPAPPRPATAPSAAPMPERSRAHEGAHEACRALEALRDFSALLTHSLRADAMLKQFLLLLREIIGVNRAAVFLRQPVSLFGGAPSIKEVRRMSSACAMGLSPGLLEHFQLSFESGMGGFLFRHARILRRENAEAQDAEIQKEFELLGAQVAIPMLDRETLIGVAVFDGRLTGEPLTNAELELIFHLLEELGLAVKNIWLHDQLASSHEIMVDILRQFSSACVVVNRDLHLVHANKAARHFFGRSSRRDAELEFSDLPQILGGKIYQVLKTGTALAPFRYTPADAPDRVYLITIVPFQREDTSGLSSVLVLAEDRTQTEQLQKLEIETANLRLIKTMADRLAHEIGNALVPLATHQQLLTERYKDPDFRASLGTAMTDSVKRVSRLLNQMRFLYRDVPAAREAFPLEGLVAEAFQEAKEHQAAKLANLRFDSGTRLIFLTGDRPALKHALAEVLLNAIQANPSQGTVDVRARTDAEPGDLAVSHVEIEVEDSGAGFTPEAIQKVPQPFYTTRTVGLGLGLTVSRRIIEIHQGRLTVVPPQSGQHGLVRISLPTDLASIAKS